MIRETGEGSMGLRTGFRDSGFGQARGDIGYYRDGSDVQRTVAWSETDHLALCPRHCLSSPYTRTQSSSDWLRLQPHLLFCFLLPAVPATWISVLLFNHAAESLPPLSLCPWCSLCREASFPRYWHCFSLTPSRLCPDVTFPEVFPGYPIQTTPSFLLCLSSSQLLYFFGDNPHSLTLYLLYIYIYTHTACVHVSLLLFLPARMSAPCYISRS